MMNSANGSQTNSQTHNLTKQIRVLIVDDQKMICEGLKALIKTEEDLKVVGTADNGKDAIKQVETLQPDVVLMDMEMPGMDGVDATSIICEKFRNVKVLVLSTYDSQEYVARSLDSGAMGYLLKGTPAQELTEAIRSVHRGYAQIGPSAFQKILPLTPKNNLNPGSEPSALASPYQSQPANVAKHGEGNGRLASTNSSGENSALVVKNKSPLSGRKFEQTVMLRQSPKWSRATIWAVIGVTVFAIIWSAVAKIEQVVPAQGLLKPVGKVKEVQVPANGVVEEVEVEEGERVEKGELLLKLDSTASTAQIESLKNIRSTLSQENKFYRALMNDEVEPTRIEQAIAQLEIPREIVALARNRAAYLAENKLFRQQLGLSTEGNLSPDQLARLKANQAELNSRANAARLEVEQLEKQLKQNQVELADTKAQLATAKQVLAEINQRNQESIAQTEESLKIERSVLDSIAPLVEAGALSRLQLDRQQQEVNDRYSSLVEQRASGTIEADRQRQEIETLKAQIEQLQSEQQRLQLDIAQAREELTNATASTEKDIQDQIGENQKRLAEIDSQLNRTIVNNDNRIAEINSQISSTEQTLKYQVLYAPVSGTVFDLQAYPGYVPPAGQGSVQAAEPILKIVPDDNLIAEVFITTQDIGFVEEGMPVDVRIDTFSFSEFGDVKGEVISIGSDALEPNQTYNFYRFPARVKLDQQYLEVRGRDLPLKSGMTVSANIKVRENRTVLSLFTDKFFTGLESFKEVR